MGGGAPATTGRDLHRIREGNAVDGGGQQHNDAQAPTEGGADATEEEEEELPVPLHTTMRWTEELLREIGPELQTFTAVDHKLMGVFGDTIHQNAGT